MNICVHCGTPTESHNNACENCLAKANTVSAVANVVTAYNTLR